MLPPVKREAACSCGQLRLIAEGDPIRATICHCLACQRRTGNVFGVQARFARDQIRVEGRAKDYVRISDDGESRTFHFCPDCGATVYYEWEDEPDMVGIPVGVFADPSFPAPARSIYESRRHQWVAVPTGVESYD